MSLRLFWDESLWTVGHALVWACLEVTLLAAVLMGVLAYRDFVSPTWTNALIFLGTTGLCAAIPIGIRTLLVERWLRERHERQLALLHVPLGVEHPLQASPSPASPSQLEITAQDGALTLSPGTLRYVRAEENYVDVVWLDGNVRQHRLLRATLSDVERRLSGCATVRCHRSYVVSLAAIERATGNAQGYRLRLSGVDEEIPVSRARVVAFVEALDRWQQAKPSL